MILDSNYLGALVDGKASALDLAEDFERRAVPTRVPTAVVWESYTGVASAGRETTVDELGPAEPTDGRRKVVRDEAVRPARRPIISTI